MYGSPPPKPSFTRAMSMALVATLPVVVMAVLIAPAMRWPDWSRWIILAAWFGFGYLAGQHTLLKMAGDAGPRWWSTNARDRLRDPPRKGD
jgi:hypothetical protein